VASYTNSWSGVVVGGNEDVHEKIADSILASTERQEIGSEARDMRLRGWDGIKTAENYSLGCV